MPFIHIFLEVHKTSRFLVSRRMCCCADLNRCTSQFERRVKFQSKKFSLIFLFCMMFCLEMMYKNMKILPWLIWVIRIFFFWVNFYLVFLPQKSYLLCFKIRKHKSKFSKHKSKFLPLVLYFSWPEFFFFCPLRLFPVPALTGLKSPNMTLAWNTPSNKD